MSNLREDPNIGTTELMARLRTARRRLVLRLGLTGAVWSALGAAVVAAFFSMAARSGGTPVAAFGSLDEWWRWAGAVLAAGLLVTALWVWRTRPDLLEMARRADGFFGLDERLSTTVELAGRNDGVDRSSPVVAALFRDAAAHASRVDPRRLVPIGVPRPAIALIVVVTGVLALELGSPAEPSAPPPGASLLAAAADPDPEAAAELILDIAELLRQEAERESNDYLRVVATSLEQLAADVVEQGSGGQAVADELARLLAHAEAASVSESDADADGFSLTLAGIEEWLQAEGQREFVARADANTRESSGAEALPASPRSLASATMARARAALEAVRAERTGEGSDAEPLDGELAANDSDADSTAADAMQGESSGAPPMDASVGGARPLANVDIGGGTAIDDAPGGDNPTQGLGGGSASVTAERVEVPDVASSRDFELPTEGGSRRRLPEEIVPQTRFTEVAESDLPRGDWSQTPQDQVTSGYLGVSYRDVASRYFLARIRRAEGVER